MIKQPSKLSRLRSKLPKTGTTIFTIMSGLAQKEGAINLSQGFPDFSGSPDLIRLVNDHMKAGNNQYAPMPGILPLREAIAAKMDKRYTAKYDPETEITITAGATQGLFAAITAVVHEGDEVILFEPAYDSYEPAIQLNGGVPVYIELQAPGYTINWDHVKKRINQRTRLIILNTPHNPTGTTLSAADMMQLQKLTQNSDILILSDEVYEHIIFDGLEHQSIARYPKLAERSFIVFSFGKTYHHTGWKTGYCLAPEYLMKEFRKIHQFQVFSCNAPIQFALAEFMNNADEYLSLPDFYQQKRDFFYDLIKDSRFQGLPSTGTYFQLLSYKQISKEKDTDFAVRLTKEHKIAAIPVSVFYHKSIDHKVLRFCFAKSEETLKEAAEKLCKI